VPRLQSGFVFEIISADHESNRNPVNRFRVLFRSCTIRYVSSRGFCQSQHLSAESKDAVRLRIGMIATMAPFVLGLLVTSAKSFYDARGSELTQLSANALLDRILAKLCVAN